MDDTTDLGDGLEARFDGWMIALIANGGTDTVYLEPRVYHALVRFAEAHGFTASPGE